MASDPNLGVALGILTIYGIGFVMGYSMGAMRYMLYADRTPLKCRKYLKPVVFLRHYKTWRGWR